MTIQAVIFDIDGLMIHFGAGVAEVLVAGNESGRLPAER